MAKLEVFALDRKLNRATLSIPYRSLEWHRCWHKCGDFTLEVSADVYDPSWFMIYTDQRRETGLIEKVQFNDDPKYGSTDTIVISGRFLESIMNDRTFLEETPEEVTYRYYVAPPSPPKAKIEKQNVYKDADGNYWYETPSGTTYGVADGTPASSDARRPGSGVKTDESGQKYIETGSGRVNVEEQSYMTQINSYYYTDGSETTVNRVQNTGTGNATTTHDIAFDDGYGNVFYHDSNTGTLKKASGVTEKQSDNYTVQMRQWRSSTDDGWVTVTKTVKGPWQITDTFDPITPMDNVARVVQWAQMYFQNEMLFVEPDFQGIVKTVDPSFQLLGDLLYSELKTVGASYAVNYDFINSQFTFEVIQGLDRTQDQQGTSVTPSEPVWKTTGRVSSAVANIEQGSKLGATKVYGATSGEGTLESPMKLLENPRLNIGGTMFEVDTKGNQLVTFDGAEDVLEIDRNGNAVIKRNVERFKPGDAGITWTPLVKDTFVMFYSTVQGDVPGVTNGENQFMECTHLQKYDGSFLSSSVGPGLFGFYQETNLRMTLPIGTLESNTSATFNKWLTDNDVTILYSNSTEEINLGTVEMPTLNGGEQSIMTESNVAHDFDVEYQERQEVVSGNPWAVFSDEWGTLYGFVASSDKSNYRNKCFVLYEYDVPTAWDGDRPKANPVYEWDESGTSRTLKGYQIPYQKMRGFETVRIEDGEDDKETYLDLRKEPPSCDGDWSREMYDASEGYPDLPSIKSQYDGYIDAIRTQGMDLLTTEYAVENVLDTGQLDVKNYLEDFDLGDKVDKMVSRLGLVQTGRITEVSEVYDDNGESVKITIEDTITEEV